MDAYRLDLLDKIKNINSYTDIKRVGELRHRIEWLNRLDKTNEPIFEEARNKGIL